MDLLTAIYLHRHFGMPLPRVYFAGPVPAFTPPADHMAEGKTDPTEE